MRAIGMTSSQPILPLPQEWTDLGDATGSTLTITSDQLPTVDSYVTCEVKASGQCLSSLVAVPRVTVVLKPNSITLAGSKLVDDQLRTSFEPDSVTEFGREPASSC